MSIQNQETTKVSYIPRTVIKNNFLVDTNFYLDSNESKIVSIAIGHYFKTKSRSMIFKATDLAEIMPISKSNVFAFLRQKTLAMISKSFEIEEPNGDIIQSNWFSKIKYYTGKGMVELKLNEEVTHLLDYDSKIGYISYDLRYILPIQSKYGVRLYELLKQRVKYGTRKFKYSDLRKDLNIEENSYKYPSDLIRHIIDVCQKEFDKYSDIKFSYEVLRIGKQVTHIEFNVLKNIKVIRKDQALDEKLKESDENLVENKILTSILSYDISNSKAEQIIKNYDEDYIRSIIDVVDDYIAAQAEKEIPFDAPSIFIKAIKEGWKKSKESQKTGQSSTQHKQAIEANIKAKTAASTLETLHQQYEEYFMSEISIYFTDLEPAKQLQIKEEYHEILSNDSFLPSVPLSSINLKDRTFTSYNFATHICDKYSVSVLCFENWCESNSDYRVEKENSDWVLI